LNRYAVVQEEKERSIDEEECSGVAEHRSKNMQKWNRA
jgi:hypothetical protein